jgi:hypothetical protein
MQAKSETYVRTALLPLRAYAHVSTTSDFPEAGVIRPWWAGLRVLTGPFTLYGKTSIEAAPE